LFFFCLGLQAIDHNQENYHVSDSGGHVDHAMSQMNHFKDFANSHFMSKLENAKIVGPNAEKAMGALLELMNDYCTNLSSVSANQQTPDTYDPDTGYHSNYAAENAGTGNGLDEIEYLGLHQVNDFGVQQAMYAEDSFVSEANAASYSERTEAPDAVDATGAESVLDDNSNGGIPNTDQHIPINLDATVIKDAGNQELTEDIDSMTCADVKSAGNSVNFISGGMEPATNANLNGSDESDLFHLDGTQLDEASLDDFDSGGNDMTSPSDLTTHLSSDFSSSTGLSLDANASGSVFMNDENPALAAENLEDNDPFDDVNATIAKALLPQEALDEMRGLADTEL
jgi:hypothetical protein